MNTETEPPDWSAVQDAWKAKLKAMDRPDVEPEWARSARARFLSDRIRDHEEHIRSMRGVWRRTDAVGRILLASVAADVRALIDSAKRTRAWVLKKPSDKSVAWCKMVDAAKAVKLWEYLDVKPKDDVQCLWHTGTKPSLRVYEDGKGHCFVCSKTADCIDYVMKLENLTFRDAVNRLA
jgi:hypothetical protein